MQAAIRILPSLLVGVTLNLITGLFVHAAPIRLLVLGSSLLAAGAPLLMAINDPYQPYWTYSFPSQLLMPMSCDIVFTIGLIIIVNTFALEKQAVAGAVFNISTQLGSSFGIAIMQVISTSVTENSGYKVHAEALLEGYKACFATLGGLMIFCAVVGCLGLGKVSNIGLRGNQT